MDPVEIKNVNLGDESQWILFINFQMKNRPYQPYARHHSSLLHVIMSLDDKLKSFVK